jgi:hypothetical protein
VAVVEQGLTRTGIRVVQLGTEEIDRAFYKLFNPGDTEKPIKIKHLTWDYSFFKKERSRRYSDFASGNLQSVDFELKDIIAPSALKVSPRSLNLGDKIVRTFFVISYPRYLAESWFAPIINLDRVFDVSIFIHPVETARFSHFQKKVAEVQSQIQMREEKGLVRDPMLDTAYQDLENLRDQLAASSRKTF